MFRTIANIFKIPDLRKKILFTTFILVLYRLGSFIPVPGVNVEALKAFFQNPGTDQTLFGLYDLFVGGNFQRASVFALGIMPYITTSIVIQLLGSIVPYFEKLRKEGAEGQKKINQLTRYGTVIIGGFNAISIAFFLQNLESTAGNVVPAGGAFFILSTMVTLVTGTMMIMWLGEQITENGIGNGISLIIFAGIIDRYPAGFWNLFQDVRLGEVSIIRALIMVALMVAVTAAVILITEATRKIPVQYAKRFVGRKMYGGHSTYIPLRVNSAGVIPIIFANSVIMFPRTIAMFAGGDNGSAFWVGLVNWLSPGHAFYTFLYVSLIVFFAYFYTAIVLNPVEMAENMKRYGGFIPGKKPGKKTSDYINNVIVRITLPGAIFFAIVAIMPDFFVRWGKVDFNFGGTGLIIVVGVALDTLQQIESHLVMRHYDGFMKKGKLRGRTGR